MAGNLKIKARKRRSLKARGRMRKNDAIRLSVHRTGAHIYAQVFSAAGDVVLASASTTEKDLKSSLKCTSNVEAAKAVGSLVAKRAIDKGVKTVAFDRGGLKYHGRIKALADAARESGLEF